MPVKLVPRGTSHDTIQALTEILEAARRGDVLGTICGVMYSNLDIDLWNTGEFDKNPLFARSIAAELDDYLSEQTKNNH